MPKHIQLSPRDIIREITHGRFHTIWDQRLNLLQALDEQHGLNSREKFMAQLILKSYEEPETHNFYWEQSAMGPFHPWIKDEIDRKVLHCPTSETNHYLCPEISPLSEEQPEFVIITQEQYEKLKEEKPTHQLVQVYENGPMYSQYTLTITRRVERNIDRIINTQSIKAALSEDGTKLSDAVTIEVPFGIGKVNVLKLWEWLTAE